MTLRDLPRAASLRDGNGLPAVVEEGIYYWAPRGSDGRWPLMFFDLASRTSSIVARIAADRVAFSLTACRDRKTLLYTASLTSGNDLKVVEPFR